MKTMRKIIEIDEEKCDGCGQCVISCAEGALAIIDGKAKVISENLCDGLGACIGECPQGALRIIEREAEEFDEEAVINHLESRQKEHANGPGDNSGVMACGCPSTNVQLLTPAHPGHAGAPSYKSALSHWPIQIRLITPNALFLKGADLLVLADCAAVSVADLHGSLLPGKVVAMGCPKFDDSEAYVQKFAEIFASAGIKSITIAYMEVPCCGGLPVIVKKAMEKAGKNIPVRRIMYHPDGRILEDQTGTD